MRAAADTNALIRSRLMASLPSIMNVEQDAVAIGKLMLAERAGALKQLSQHLALIARQRRRREPRIVRSDLCDLRLACLDILDLEADMVHAAGDDPRAVIVRDVPRHDDERHVPVAQIEVPV